MLAAMKGLLRQAFALGLIDADPYARSLGVKSVKGTRVKGLAISHHELKALFAKCSVSTMARARDASPFGIANGAGLRRVEIVGLDLADYYRRSGDCLRHMTRVLGRPTSAGGDRPHRSGRTSSGLTGRVGHVDA